MNLRKILCNRKFQNINNVVNVTSNNFVSNNLWLCLSSYDWHGLFAKREFNYLLKTKLYTPSFVCDLFKKSDYPERVKIIIFSFFQKSVWSKYLGLWAIDCTISIAILRLPEHQA